MSSKYSYILIPCGTIATAVLGSLFTDTGAWYAQLTKPSWTPPGSVIGTVWTIIFILTMVSALLVWSRARKSAPLKWITLAFVVNAILNILWSAIFFQWHFLTLAVIEAGLLGLSVIVLMKLTWPISRIASLLLLPYAGWVCFATYLTYLIMKLN